MIKLTKKQIKMIEKLDEETQEKVINVYKQLALISVFYEFLEKNKELLAEDKMQED